MANPGIIYETKYGSTRQYAQWLAEELAGDIFARKAVGSNELNAFDTVIYGGPIYVGRVRGIEFIRHNFEVLRSKHLIVFTCGLNDPTDQENVPHIREGLSKTLTADMLEHLKVFHLSGAIDYNKLNLVHRAMMAMRVRPLKKKDPASLTTEERHMLDTYGKTVSFMERSAIAPIVQYARAL